MGPVRGRSGTYWPPVTHRDSWGVKSEVGGETGSEEEGGGSGSGPAVRAAGQAEPPGTPVGFGSAPEKQGERVINPGPCQHSANEDAHGQVLMGSCWQPLAGGTARSTSAHCLMGGRQPGENSGICFILKECFIIFFI